MRKFIYSVGFSLVCGGGICGGRGFMYQDKLLNIAGMILFFISGCVFMFGAKTNEES